MAHHLPRKKYLSKLLGDSPEDKNRRTSSPSNVDSTSCETLAANESSESLLIAIANSTKLGISSEFGSAVFTVDTDKNCSAADEIKDETKCCEVPSQSGPDVAGDEETGERESSPVYFDDGSIDDDDDANEMKSGIDSVDDEMASGTNASVVSVCSHLQTNQIHDTDMMPSSSSSACLAIPASASMSSLIDDDVLSTLLPSAESFANLLNSLETRERKPMSTGPGSSTVSDEQLEISMQQRQQAQVQLAVASLAGTSSSRPTDMLSMQVESVCVKEEHIDSSYEQPATTTSGRNRGRGKATEPKFDCQICGDVAAGYHCGAYVCEACKVFTVTL